MRIRPIVLEDSVEDSERKADDVYDRSPPVVATFFTYKYDPTK
jgi:hypothetical protein